MDPKTKQPQPFPMGAVCFFAFVLLGGMGVVGELLYHPPTLNEVGTSSVWDRAIDAAAKTRERIWDPEKAKQKELDQAVNKLRESQQQWENRGVR